MSKILYFIGLIALCFGLSTSPCQAQALKRVLILNSYSLDSQWTEEEITGIRSVLDKGTIDLSYAFMDTKHIAPSRNNFEQLYEEYRYFYRTPFDLILATDNDAFNFLRIYRDRLFPRTPVVFCGVNYFQDSMLNGHQGFTGVVESFDLKKTLDVALRLQPNTKRIAFINDRSPTGQENRHLLEKIIPRYHGVQFDFFEDLTFNELLTKVRRLRKDSIILLMTFNRDKAGRAISYKELLRSVTRVSPVPSYGVWDFFLGHGIVGGDILRGYDQGYLAATVATRILKGEKDIPVIKDSPKRLMFDYKQLKHFGIPLSELPQGSVVINRPASSYNIKKEILWIIAAFILFLGISIFLLLINISNMRRSAKEIKESETKFRMLTEMANAAILIVQQHQIKYLNSYCERLTGYSKPELHSMELWAAIAPEFQSLLKKQGKEASPQEFRIIRKNGEERWVSLSSSPIVYEGLESRLDTIYDLTDRRKAEEEREKALQQKEQLDALKEAERLKDEFFSVISHEMRTPLNAILGFGSLLGDEVLGPLAPRQHEAIDRILDGSDRMLALINNILDLARMRTGRFELQFGEVHYPEIVEKTLAFLTSLAQKKKITLESDVPEMGTICLDQGRITQVLINLIENAIKFTPPGGKITIQAWKENKQLITEVTDTGIGIAKEDIPKLFSPFVQLDMGLTRKVGGTGLGLSIAKQIVEGHGGHISVRSPGPGKGATFRFELPL